MSPWIIILGILAGIGAAICVAAIWSVRNMPK
jgi:hypothetical protein